MSLKQTQVFIVRQARIPDRLRLARYRKCPELGPRILFFSGGTALRNVSQRLLEYTHNSIHLITTFDSGGSSAQLRKAFDMPAVGDLRNRLMALADPSVRGNHEIAALFAHRFPRRTNARQLRQRLRCMEAGDDPAMRAIDEPMRSLICNHLHRFMQRAPRSFDLRGASIGNLVLAGGYLNNRRQLDSVVYLFSKLAEVRGTVRPITTQVRHVIAELENGRLVRGQHRMTGKDTAPIASPVKRIYLAKSMDNYRATPTRVDRGICELIRQADLICYPMGSFYSSVIVNLLPAGVAQAVAENTCPKVYVPSLGRDPEQRGKSVAACAGEIVQYLQPDTKAPAPVDRLLNLVLLNKQQGRYANGIDEASLQRLGVRVVDTALCAGADANQYDDVRLVQALLSLT